MTTLELIKFLVAAEFPDFSRKMGLTAFPKDTTSFFARTFMETFEYRKKNNVQRNDFVSMLLGLKEFFTPMELAAESMLVFGAGFETSSTLMTFTLYALATNLDIQNKLRDELTAGIEENDGKLTYEMLFGFKYLDMVINESLRMYPPIADNVRKAAGDYQIAGTKLVIPKDTLISINTISLQNDPQYYPEPEKFIPERFSDENVKNIKPFTFIPFGEGNRQCLGMRFGLMQSKMGIAKLITNFTFSPAEKTTIPMKFMPSAPFLAPINGMWLKVEKI
jgi:cytochrome P450 family 6